MPDELRAFLRGFWIGFWSAAAFFFRCMAEGFHVLEGMCNAAIARRTQEQTDDTR